VSAGSVPITALITERKLDDTVGMHPNMERRLFEIFEEEILKELDPAIHQLRNKIGEIMQRTRDRLRIETQPGPQQIYLESSTPGTASLETSDGNRSWENSSSDQMSSTVQTVSLNLSITDETNHDEHPPHQQHTSLVSPSGDYIGPSAPDNQYQPSPSLDSFSTPPSTTILPNAYDTSAIDFYMFRDFGPAAATPETAYTPRSLPFPSALPDYMTTSSDIDDATDTQYIFDAHGPQFTSNLDDPFAM
jgi:hypothetical protein